jgi:hypothetical protein
MYFKNSFITIIQNKEIVYSYYEVVFTDKDKTSTLFKSKPKIDICNLKLSLDNRIFYLDNIIQ